MITVEWADVMSVVQLVSGHLTALGVLLVIAIAAIVFSCLKLKSPLKGLVNGEALIAFGLAAVLIVNLMLNGPLYNTLNVVLTDSGELTQEHADASRALVEEISSEGIILAKNDGGLPLAPSSLNNGQINVFGWASTNPIYGGTGSGAVDVATAVDILKGLENAGYTVNQELVDKYKQFRSDRPVIDINNGQDWSLPEPTADSYSQELMNNAKDFSDWAIVVIARSGGEGADLPHDMGKVLDGELDSSMREGRSVHAHGSYWEGTKYTNALYTPNSDSYDDFEYGQHYLELSRTEKDLVDLVTSNFDNVIVVYNGANTMEMGWTEDYEQIRGVLLCAGPGATGFNALGKIISGEVNPSAKTVDLWARDLTAAPWYQNIGHHNYTDEVALGIAQRAKEHWERADGYVTFVNYLENNYVGYKFYETAYADGMAGFDYDSAVMYPFGYGLSYTEFEQSITDTTQNGDTVTVTVNVTNTGSVAGKSVVELYSTPPYTNGGIEKSAVNLVGFGKTGMLQPGASETVTIKLNLEDLASYDTGKKVPGGGYILEAGNYVLSVRSDSHTVLDETTVTVSSDVIYDQNNLHNGDVVAATNRFDFARGDVTYLSRENSFANYAQAVAAPTNLTLPGELHAHGSYNPEDYNDPNDPIPTTGASGTLKLGDLRGADYDDPRWEELLDQVTVDEMVELIAYGGHQTAAVNSVGKIRTLDTDGPAGMSSPTLSMFGTGYCCNMIISQTWNRELAYKA
ncbi:MAG: glycoside hydrolase family 3 C-terminal domain-containing protein, partial [Oscillospiraceae bacterium]|nr:glycoside hydrolase family 3 C-terminal domain-containing protein [Oscillospiraceae bacterium]